jgi:hypothetical protein
VTLRLAAALALALGAGALILFLHLLGETPFASPAARHLRAMKDRTSVPDSIAPTTIHEMMALPHGHPLAEYAAIERRGVSLEGYVQHLMRASDGDFHLEIAERPVTPGGWNTEYISAEITPRMRSGSSAWTYQRLLERFHPLLGGATSWTGGTRRVRISGWLMYDWQYDNPPLPGSPEHDATRLTGWEIHPVTRIAVWNPDSARFEELRR